MHVTPGDLRPVRRDGHVLRVAILGGAGYAIVDALGDATTTTTIETACDLGHWGFVVQGGAEIVAGDSRLRVDAGDAFHVAPRTPHAIEAVGGARLMAFVPSADEAALRAGILGSVPGTFETIVPSFLPPRPTLFPGSLDGDPEPRRIVARGRRMGEFVFTRVRLGVRSGFLGGFCDLPHWGLVLDGRLTIEWEDDVAALSAGDLFHCPAGPPGHRLLGADPALLVDFTPVDAYHGGLRMAEWRATLARPIFQSPASDVDAGFAVEVAHIG